MVMRVEKQERMPTIDTLLLITDALEVDLAALLKKALKEVRESKE
jgi:transcriptional regulator with XRE-family HTH domain